MGILGLEVTYRLLLHADCSLLNASYALGGFFGFVLFLSFVPNQCSFELTTLWGHMCTLF